MRKPFGPWLLLECTAKTLVRLSICPGWCDSQRVVNGRTGHFIDFAMHHNKVSLILTINWTASSEFGTYRLWEQRRFRRACASAQSRQNLRCSLIQAVSQEEPSDRKPDPWPLWMAGHAQLKFVMTECSKTQIRLAGPNLLNSHSDG